MSDEAVTITMAPVDMSRLTAQWTATGELRYIVPNITNIGMPKLQQLWIEKFSGQTEWRSIPTIVVTSQEFFGS